MSTIKVDTIATRTGSGNITASNAILAPSIGGSSDTNTSLSFPGSDVVQLNNAGTARHKFHNLNGTSLFEVQASSTGGSGAGGAFLKFKGSNGTPVDIASIDGSMTNGSIGSESGILSFFTTNSGTNSEKVRIFSNGAMAVPNGISLGNGISAAASNLLDDYEEGQWTPNVYNTNYSSNWTTKKGDYIKVGKIVHCWFVCDHGNSNSGSGSGDLAIAGLPFNISSESTSGSTFAHNSTQSVGMWSANPSSQVGNLFAFGSAVTFKLYKGGSNIQSQLTFVSGSFSYIAQ